MAGGWAYRRRLGIMITRSVLVGLVVGLTFVVTGTAWAQYNNPPPPSVEPTRIEQPPETPLPSPTSSTAPSSSPSSPGSTAPTPITSVLPTRLGVPPGGRPSSASETGPDRGTQGSILALTGGEITGIVVVAAILIGGGVTLVRRSRRVDEN